MKLAVICGGKPQLDKEQPLKHIGDSINEVVATLENNGWKCEPFVEATNDEDYKSLLSQYNIDDISEFLFYYIGHGKGSNLTTFEIMLHNTSWTLEQIKLRTKEAFKNHLPRKMAIVLDACYSGNAINKNDRVGDVELLTSSDRNSQTFENTMPDGKGWSEFSYYFCEAFKTSHDSDTLDLEQIGKYITHEKQMGRDTYYLPNPSQQTDKIIIGYVKEINDIKDILKSYYDNDIKNLKDDFLTYLLRDAIFYDDKYDRIKNCNDINNIINYLLEDKECLYCILKDKNPQIIKEYESILKEVDCEERKEEDSLKQIVFLIGNEQTGDTNSLKYDVKSYRVTEKNRVRTGKTKDKVDFSIKSEYENIIVKFISNIEKQQISENTVEIVFILPKELHNINFSKIELNDEELTEGYDIFVQLYDRYLHIDKEAIHEYIARWKVNSNRYMQYKQNNIEQQYLFTISNNAECKGFGKRYNRRGSQAICLVSSITLVSYIETIISSGLPIVVFPWDDNCPIITTSFRVEEIKYNLLEYISDNGDNHYFMYDLYHETKELKEQLEQNKKSKLEKVNQIVLGEIE